MASVGVIIFFAIVGSFICAKARIAAGAIVFALIAVVLFIATPVGAGLPGMVSHLVSTIDHAVTPALDGSQASG